MKILYICFYILPLFGLSQDKAKSNANNLDYQKKVSKDYFFWEVQGDFFPSRQLRKGEKKIGKFLSHYKLGPHVKNHLKSYEQAVLHKKYATSANLFFYTMTIGGGAGLYGVFSQESGIIGIGGLIFLLSIWPYIYYDNKAQKYLNQSINMYNEVKTSRTIHSLPPLNVQFSFTF